MHPSDIHIELSHQFEALLSADTHVHQSVAMAELYQNSDKYSPLIITARDSENQLVGHLLAAVISERKFLPKFLTSRVVVYGGPILHGDKVQRLAVLESILSALVEEVQRRTVFIQFRNFWAWSSEEKAIFEKHGFYYEQRLNQITDCTNRQEMWGRISRSKRNQINRSFRNGAEIVAARDEEEVKTLYAILSNLYRMKVQKPLPSQTYFLSAFRLKQEGKPFEFLLIKYKSQIIGGIFCPYTPNSTIYESYVCGLDSEYQKLGIFPSVLATYAAMDYAVEHAIPNFDFMGLGHPDRAYGVREFKTRFGGAIVNNGRFERINNRLLFAVVELGYNVLALFKRV